jgi:hypothetical protein
MGTIGSGLNRIGQQIGQNPTIQQIGDDINSKWINVKQIPRKFLQLQLNHVRLFRANSERLTGSHAKHAWTTQSMGTASFRPEQPEH